MTVQERKEYRQSLRDWRKAVKQAKLDGVEAPSRPRRASK
jgi:hypothetical protein